MDLYIPGSALVFVSFPEFYRSILQVKEKRSRHKLLLAEKYNPQEKGE